MTAFSYQEWNGLGQEKQKQNPGVSIPRSHELNNPNRGTYWSGQSSSTALSSHVRDVLTGPDRQGAERMFRLLKLEHRKAVESSRAVDRALKPRQIDADRALESSGFSLTDEQADQLQSAADDIYRIQDQAEVMGINPVDIANAMIDRASSAAVGFAPPRADQMREEFREYLESPQGRESQGNLNQSVRQLYSQIRLGEIDALDRTDSISDLNLGEDRTMGDERDFINSIVKSIPLERNPNPIEPEKNFSVRMDTVEEAKAMEMMLRWAGEKEQLPAPEQVHEAFSSWKDNGLVSSPFEPRPINRVGLIVGTGNTAENTAESIIAGFDGQEESTQLIVLTSENRSLGDKSELNGRPIVEGVAKANENGVYIEGLQDAPDNAIVLMNLSREEATDSVKRSTAANAFVGSAYSVCHIAGKQMSPHEAQAIHLAGSMRKLTLAIDSSGKQVGNVQVGKEQVFEKDENGNLKRTPIEYMTDKDGNFRTDVNGYKMRKSGGQPIPVLDEKGKAVFTPVYENGLKLLRKQAQEVDQQADPNRYFAAGLARPRVGVTTVAFDGARNYDAAIRRYANGKDVIGDAYSRIPKHAAIITTDKKEMAAYRWLEQNVKDRNVLYAEAKRTLSFALDVDAGLDTEKVIAREAETEMKLYDRPRSERGQNPERFEVDWNSPQVRGALILVRGNTLDGVINSAAQETKVAQEAIMDFAHTGVIFDDMQNDFHAAHLTRIGLEMGKPLTVLNKEGETVPLSEARDLTRKNAQSLTEITDHEMKDRFRGDMTGLNIDPRDINRMEHGRKNVSYSLAEPVGQMALAAMPGMNPQKAAGLAKLPLTLEEIYTTQDPEVKKALYQNGMPSDTVKKLGDRKMWEKAVERALKNDNESYTLDSRFAAAGASRMLPEGSAGFIHGPDHDRPIMAFIGNSMKTYDGVDGKPIDPADLVDRKQLAASLKAAHDKGYAIATTLDEGVGTAVLEELKKIPDAKVVVAAPGNPRAAPGDLAKTLADVMENGNTQVVMPTAIAGTPYETQDGVASTRFADLRSTMHNNIAHFSDVAVVVQASSSDQVMNVVDKMNAKDKPVAVMLPNDPELASTDAYRGNLRLARGAGKTSVESLSLATVPSAQGYAEVSDIDTEVKLIDGVMRGNAGTFQSARLSRSDMARGGNHYKTVGWGSAARTLFDEKSVERLAEDHKQGNLPALGAYKEPTAQELEKLSLKRTQVDEGFSQEFKNQQKQYAAQIENDARQMTF